MTSEPAPRGTIYDIGYRPYEGRRLGRRFAIWSLYVLSLRNAFGLGRGVLPKVLAFGLVIVAFIPAIVVIIIAAVVPSDEFEVFRPHRYYGIIQFIIILFAAALSSDLVGNDRRQGTLALYFSRPILRGDYAAAKLAALTTSLLAVTVLPQLVMFGGNWLGASDAWEWVKQNGDDLAPIVGSGLLICVMVASLGIACAAFAERRSFALVAILVVFALPGAVATTVIEISEGDAARYIVLFSPFHVMRGFTLFLFDAFPPASQSGNIDAHLAFVDLRGYVYLLAAFIYTGGAIALAFSRFRSPS